MACHGVIRKKEKTATSHGSVSSLDELIKRFAEKSEVKNKSEIEAHDLYLSKLRGITDFICGEVNDRTLPDYREFKVDREHQRYLDTELRRPYVRKFINFHKNIRPIKDLEFNNFEELFEYTAKNRQPYIGPTCVYDFALRFGWNRNKYAGKDVILPEKYVYFHTGPLRSAILLSELLSNFPLFEPNIIPASYRIPIKELYSVIPAFKKYNLRAKDIEHFLCLNFEGIRALLELKAGRIIDKSKIKINKTKIKQK